MTNGRSLVAALLLLAVPALLFGQPPADLLCMKELASALKLDSASVPSASCRELGAYKQRSLSIFLEEDFLQRYGSTSDRNYTMGLGVGLSGSWITRRNMDLPLRLAEHSVDWALGLVKIDHFIARRNLEDLSKNRAYSLMLSGTAFTPKDLRADAPVVGDRPYAFMLGWTTSRATGDADSDDAYLSDFTFGTIGSEIGRNAQRFIHSRSRASSHEPTPYDPKGWANQIYDHALFGVGMPTARYGLVKMHRLAYVNTNTAAHTYLFDATQELGGDLGYYTDANFGLRVRAGLFSIPFWAWREDPLTSGSRGVADDAHACVDIIIGCLEGFAYAGGRARAIGYNALLQGYPGYSGYHLGWGDRKYVGTEAEAGLTATFWNKYWLKFGIQGVFELWAHRSAEYTGPYTRPHTWGGLYLTPIW